MKEDILLDVDEVICFSGFLEAVNEFLHTNYQIDDIEDYYIDRALIPPHQFAAFNKFISQRNFYESPQILPGAVQSIQKLNEYYNIYICSSCINPADLANSGKMFKDKYDFLIKTFPFINPGNFIFTSSKHLFKADIQIDDLVSNFKGDIKLKILFPSYHNKNITDEELRQKNIIRAGLDWKTGWKQVEDILLKKFL